MCDTRYIGNTVVSTDCETGSTNNHDVTQVNLDSMFGITDWEEVFRDESAGGLSGTGYSISFDGDLLGGDLTLDWDLASFLGYDEFMLVLKDGAGPTTDPQVYVGWLLDPGDYGWESYTFESPFQNTNTGGLKQISNAALYAWNDEFTTRDCTENCTNEVPEPTPLAMMALGLLAMRQFRRKRVV